jgi:methyltransferase (TIGR00027 family)
MLKSLKRISYQVLDTEKAAQWYSEILNTKPIFETPFVSIFQIGDCTLSLVKGKDPLPELNERVEIYWDVDDIENVYQKLIEKGAVEHSPVKSVLNIKVAKVIDPFGNIIGLTSTDTGAGKRNVENTPSETAMNVCFCRAIASVDERERIKGPDYIAKVFLNDESKKILSDENARTKTRAYLSATRMYGYFTARTSYIDSVFIQECKENIEQIVFLGAGYDTRSFRFAGQTIGINIFELDIHSTQQKKITDLKNAGISFPQNLSFVEINFKTDKLEDVLFKAGYSKTKRTLFIWEGVMYYLTENAVNDTFDFIKNNSTAGSVVCFDYLTQKLQSINPSEPFLAWFEKDNMQKILEAKGFELMENLDHSEIEKRFLSSNQSEAIENTIPFFCFAKAKVVV